MLNDVEDFISLDKALTRLGKSDFGRHFGTL